MNRLPFSLFSFLFAAASVHCGGVVAPAGESGTIVSPPTPPAQWTETVCADVKSACGAAPAMYVRGHATGLAALEGARAEFAVRYLTAEGVGLDVPHGVVVGRTRVRGGEVETCVCVPHGANMYPEIAAVVFSPETTGEAGRDVARAMYSQRYATLGDENFSDALSTIPDVTRKEAAVAAMVERATSVTLLGLSGADGVRIVAGVIADDRPVAPQLSGAALKDGSARIQWTMPGRTSATERVVFFIDRNGNGKCDVDADAGAIVPFAGTIDTSSKLLVGAELAVVCNAIRADSSRE